MGGGGWGGGGGSKVCAQKVSSSGEKYCQNKQRSNGNAADRWLVARRFDSWSADLSALTNLTHVQFVVRRV